MESVLRDLRFAIRLLVRRPSFTIAALVALALGVGATGAVYGVFDAVLLTPLPYGEPDRLVRIKETNPGKGIAESPVSPVAFDDLRRQTTSLVDAAGWWYPNFNLTSGDGDPHRAASINTTDNFFEIIGVHPILGRGFEAGEDERGRAPVAVISYQLWNKRYGGDPNALGRPVTLDGVDHRLIGVMPDGFSFPGDTEIWLPLGWDPARHSRGTRIFGVLGRLAEGITAAQAQAEIDILTEGFAQEYPTTNAGWGGRVQLLRDDLVGEVMQALWVLLIAVGFVLLIAGANVANLLLVQAASRAREVAVRRSLGAGRRRLLGQFLIEGLVLGGAGGIGALLVASGGTQALLQLAPTDLPQLDNVAIDLRMLVTTVTIAVVLGLASSILPGLSLTRNDFVRWLNDGGKSSSVNLRGRRLLIAGEVALALILLFGASLLVRSFYRVLTEKPGFDPANILSLNLQLPRSTYGEWTDVTTFYQQLGERLPSVPGVTATSLAAFLPLEAGFRVDFKIDEAEGLDDRDQPEAQYHVVGPGYFELLRIPLLNGREFDPYDGPNRPGVVILNRAAAERYWPDEDPLGEVIEGQVRHFGALGRVLTPSLAVEIVGVVENVKNTSLEAAPEPAIYFPQNQLAYRSMNVLLRVDGELAATESAVKAAIWELDRNLPLSRIGSLESFLGSALARRRFVMLLLSFFAGLSFVLAMIGTYGVMSQVVGARRREMGIRVALGARRIDIVGLLVGQGLGLVGLGVGAGLLGAWLLRNVMASLVFGVTTADAASVLVAVSLIFAAAFVACYLPARRAGSTDPMAVLRAE